MFKIVACISIAFLLATSLIACSGTKATDSTRVKCPACGYEFDVSGGR